MGTTYWGEAYGAHPIGFDDLALLAVQNEIPDKSIFDRTRSLFDIRRQAGLECDRKEQCGPNKYPYQQLPTSSPW